MPNLQTVDISHAGFVSEVSQGRVKVSLFRPEACGSCHMKDYCAGDQEERQEFEVNADGYQVGDEVQLHMSTTTGLRAVMVAYILPFVILVSSLIIGLQSGLSENMAGLVSLLLTGLYYLLLRLFSTEIKGHFSIQIQKLQSHE
ncbi:MAG: SoxR reducing system RseC family protein [Bacteroidota bacterium]